MTKSTSQKRPRIRAKPSRYATLRRGVLERDSWRCQQCGSLRNLDVHHLKRRSALGDDAEANLIALCRDCHQVRTGSHFLARDESLVTNLLRFDNKGWLARNAFPTPVGMRAEFERTRRQGPIATPDN
jgi:5-methylcytosine-specific restriction endonuclease McrA